MRVLRACYERRGANADAKRERVDLGHAASLAMQLAGASDRASVRAVRQCGHQINGPGGSPTQRQSK